MKELIQKFALHKKEVRIALIVLLIVILVIFLFLNGVLKWPANNKQVATVEQSFDKDLIDQAKKMAEQKKSQDLSAKWVSVKIATLADSDYGKIITGKVYGCDIVRMVDRNVPYSPAILNATLKELFAYNQDFDYLPGNFVAKQEKLKFDKAVIENGTAKIYLTGEVVYGGACDNPRLTAQITETAKQFPTVKNVQIFLNDKPYIIPSGK